MLSVSVLALAFATMALRRRWRSKIGSATAPAIAVYESAAVTAATGEAAAGIRRTVVGGATVLVKPLVSGGTFRLMRIGRRIVAVAHRARPTEIGIATTGTGSSVVGIVMPVKQSMFVRRRRAGVGQKRGNLRALVFDRAGFIRLGSGRGRCGRGLRRGLDARRLRRGRGVERG